MVRSSVIDRRTRFFRALLGVALWGLAVLPTLVGAQRCTFARVFHRPCPGCGMTRAIDLLLIGQWRASLHMHPLAVPTLLAGGAFALSTVWTTWVFGLPLVHKSVVGRAALGALVLVYVASFVLWGLRFAGWFGGPVPV
jgi:hypothetical protein